MRRAGGGAEPLRAYLERHNSHIMCLFTFAGGMGENSKTIDMLR